MAEESIDEITARIVQTNPAARLSAADTGSITAAIMAAVDAGGADMVNSPPHYKRGGLEAIDVIEAFELGFCRGNAVKYLLRAGRKRDEIEDLKKAVWYIQREIGRLEKKAA